MRIIYVFLLIGWLLPTVARAGLSYEALSLQTELPTGDAAVDTIQVDYYRAQSTGMGPVVVVLPPIGSSARDPLMQRLARFAVSHGISAAVMTLPYHGPRWPRTEGRHADAALHFLSGDPARASQAFAQSASDVTTVVSYLETRPETDKARIGVVGVSLGAIVAHLAMGRDDRLGVGVAMLGGGDLLDLSLHSFSAQLLRLLHPAQRIPRSLSVAQASRQLSRVDPLTYADQNRPRHVYMVAAARDAIIPPRDAEKLWRALGRPPIHWLDSNHFALRLAAQASFKASLEYFEAIWSAATPEAKSAVGPPDFDVPTIKIGVIAQTRGTNSLGITPAVTYQLASAGTWSSHLSIAHLDVGLTGHGPFAGAALTLGSYADIGFASRLAGTVAAPRPYVGLHITF